MGGNWKGRECVGGKYGVVFWRGDGVKNVRGDIVGWRYGTIKKDKLEKEKRAEELGVVDG